MYQKYIDILEKIKIEIDNSKSNRDVGFGKSGIVRYTYNGERYDYGSDFSDPSKVIDYIIECLENNNIDLINKYIELNSFPSGMGAVNTRPLRSIYRFKKDFCISLKAMMRSIKLEKLNIVKWHLK